MRRISRLAFAPLCWSRGGIHCAPLRRTSRLSFISPCRGRGGVNCAPLRQTSRLGFSSPCRGRGGVQLRPVEANLSSLFRLSLPGARSCPLRRRETNLSSWLQFSQPGPRRRSLRPLDTNLSSQFRPLSRGRGGVHCTPLRRTSRLGLPVAGIPGGRCVQSCPFGLESSSLDRIIVTDVDPRSNLSRHRQHSLFLRRGAGIDSVPSSVAAAAQLVRAVGPCLAFLAIPVVSPNWSIPLVALALLPSPPAPTAEPSPTSLVPLPPRPCLPRRLPVPLRWPPPFPWPPPPPSPAYKACPDFDPCFLFPDSR